MNKILVTGGAGFIGSHLVQRLLTDGSEVVVVDNIDDYYDQSIKRANLDLFKKEVSYYDCTILDNHALSNIFQKEKINKIVHLAARPGVRPSLSKPVLYNEQNTVGTIRLLELTKKHQIEQFIFGSTSSIYGNNKIPFKEDDSVDTQLSPYSISKRNAEIYCKHYAQTYNIPTTCLRFFSVYGPRQRPDMAIHKFTSLIYDGKPIPMFGDGSTSRDYTYVSDIIDGVVNTLFEQFSFEIINLGNSSPVTLKKLISLIEQAAKRKAIINKQPEQLGDMTRTFASIKKAQKLLNYKPKVSLQDGLPKFIKWYESNQLEEMIVKN